VEKVQKFLTEAALRRDCEIALPLFHKLDVSKIGVGQLKAAVQNAIKYRLKIGTIEQSRFEIH
jgi:hypothetical protein